MSIRQTIINTLSIAGLIIAFILGAALYYIYITGNKTSLFQGLNSRPVSQTNQARASNSATPTVTLISTTVAAAPTSDKNYVDFEFRAPFNAPEFGLDGGYFGVCPYCRNLVAYRSTTCGKCRKEYQWRVAEKTCSHCEGRKKITCYCVIYASPGSCLGSYMGRSVSGTASFTGCWQGKCYSCKGKGKDYRKQTCDQCRGSGICPACKGNGICPLCHKTGEMDCFACGGKGVVVVGDMPYGAPNYGFREYRPGEARYSP